MTRALPSASASKARTGLAQGSGAKPDLIPPEEETAMKQLTRLFVLVLIVLATAPEAQAGKLKTANVMAPLDITDENQWNSFDQQLRTAKAMGVDAVSSDVWWGGVESKGDQQFDWSFYDRLSDAIINAGLKWVPILSFHACGGNVGDQCDIALPKWVWTKFGDLPQDDLQYRSEQGNLCKEVVSLWADDHIMNQYHELMEAFENHFASKAQHILEINISSGPAGELRYPSYNQHDQGTGFPNRGALQCYGRLAKEDFRRWVMKKYGNLDKVNAAWGTQLTDPTQIDMPSDPNGFFSRKDYLNITYGKDLTTWLNGSLIAHGQRLIQTAQDTFDQAMKGVELGIKIPGVHWRMADPNMPRVAEVNAGLIPTSIDLNADATAHGYQPIISTVADFKDAPHPVVLHFTCLEMGDNTPSGSYSLAETLVFWVGQGAAAQGVTIKGENALSGGVTSDGGWNHIENVFTWAPYVGLTVLRIGEVTDNDTGRRRYQQFIEKFR
jgi:beta-amylase